MLNVYLALAGINGRGCIRTSLPLFRVYMTEIVSVISPHWINRKRSIPSILPSVNIPSSGYCEREYGEAMIQTSIRLIDIEMSHGQKDRQSYKHTFTSLQQTNESCESCVCLLGTSLMAYHQIPWMVWTLCSKSLCDFVNISYSLDCLKCRSGRCVVSHYVTLSMSVTVWTLCSKSLCDPVNVSYSLDCLKCRSEPCVVSHYVTLSISVTGCTLQPALFVMKAVGCVVVADCETVTVTAVDIELIYVLGD
ncbi:hypothetical protein J6590_024818 [Homalodisca vitripennis]|nr:hypothetical protein J6590_024818 [Homalodisca vitripennis]